MKGRSLRPLLALGVCLAVAAFCRADDVVGSFHRTLNVNGRVRLAVESGAGAIEVTGTPGSAITVDGTIHESFSLFGGGDDSAAIHQLETQPPIAQAGNQITVRRPDGGWFRTLWISYVITTPPDTDLSVQTGSGRIEVAGVQGDAELRTGSGRIHVASLGGSLTASTGSGGVSFDRVGGSASLRAGSGSIVGNEVGGRLDASAASGHISIHRVDQGGRVHTSSGGMDLDQVHGDLEAGAASGSIRVGGDLGANSHWTLTAASGSISISLPSNTAAQVDLGTSSGGIYVGLPLSRQGWQSRHEVHGTLGSGTPSATLSAHAASGSIRIN